MKHFKNLLADWLAEDAFYQKVFQGLSTRRLQASLRSRADGWVAGVPFAQKVAKELGLRATWKKQSGEPVGEGEEIAHFTGKPGQIVKWENLVIGLISKPSGIASAGQKAKKAVKGRIRLVSGGWKKHPFLIKDLVWEAVSAGGLAHRIVDEPFIYLDKNYVRTFGGISQALQAVSSEPATKVIQLRGEFLPIAKEAQEAICHGAQVLMVDTGSWQDLDDVLSVVKGKSPSPGVRVAFAGGIRIEDIPALAEKGVDILDIGAAILDAPWLELTYDVLARPPE